MNTLEESTNHGEEVVVPNLKGVHYSKIASKLKFLELNFEIIDSVDYRKDFDPLTVVEQDPESGDRVKKNRKIYVKINSSSYSKVAVPDLIQVSYRQAVPTLNSIGLREGSVTYQPNIGKDMVLQMSCNGRVLKAGDKVTKTSKIDLVLGDGFLEVETPADEQLIQELINKQNQQ